MVHPSITTRRLRLTPYAMGDVGELARVMGDAHVMAHIGKGALDEAEMRAIVERAIAQWDETGMGWWAIRLCEGGRLIGQICLKPASELSDIETGYALAASVWRRGYGREALEAVVDYGRKERGLRRVIATVRPENIPSRALLEACGFVRESDLFMRGKTLCLYAHTGA